MTGLVLPADDVEIGCWIAARRARHIYEMHEHLGALEVPEKLMAEAQAAMRAFDQSRHVGDHEAAVLAKPYHAQVRHERREGVIRNLRPRGGAARDTGGFALRWKA